MTDQTPVPPIPCANVTAKQILTKARELISDPNNWIKGSLAKMSTGNTTYPEHPNACKFCSVGAILRAGLLLGEQSWALNVNLATEDLQHLMNGSIVTFNDAPTTSHKDVLAAFNTAIAIAKE